MKLIWGNRKHWNLENTYKTIRPMWPENSDQPTHLCSMSFYGLWAFQDHPPSIHVCIYLKLPAWFGWVCEMPRSNKMNRKKLFTHLIQVLYKSLVQFLFKVMVIHVFHGWYSSSELADYQQCFQRQHFKDNLQIICSYNTFPFPMFT